MQVLKCSLFNIETVTDDQELSYLGLSKGSATGLNFFETNYMLNFLTHDYVTF